LTLRGTIETTNASGLEETLERIINDKCYRIVVDLGSVTYISSAGWGIFISEIKKIRRNGGDIKLAAMVPEVREVFELLEFNSILLPFNNKGDAIADFEATADVDSSDTKNPKKN
jgi:anti-anti-sigma factor